MKLAVPEVVGVPVIAPVLALIVKPFGSDPPLIDIEYGVIPPDAGTVWLYADPTVPFVSETVVIIRVEPGMVIINAPVVVAFVESVA